MQDGNAVAVAVVVVVVACRMEERLWWLSLWSLWRAKQKSGCGGRCGMQDGKALMLSCGMHDDEKALWFSLWW